MHSINWRIKDFGRFLLVTPNAARFKQSLRMSGGYGDASIVARQEEFSTRASEAETFRIALRVIQDLEWKVEHKDVVLLPARGQDRLRFFLDAAGCD